MFMEETDWPLNHATGLYEHVDIDVLCNAIIRSSGSSPNTVNLVQFSPASLGKQKSLSFSAIMEPECIFQS